MSALAEMDELKSSRIQSELKRLGLKPSDAKRLIRNGAFDAYSPLESLRIIADLASALGDYYASLLIQTGAKLALAHPERAASCHAQLKARGFRSSDASRIICLHPKLLETSQEELTVRLDAFGALLPDESSLRFFINKKTAAILLPVEQLPQHKPAWHDDPEEFYRKLNGAAASVAATPTIENGVAHHAPVPVIARAVCNVLHDRLERLGLHGADVTWVASRFERAFAERAEDILKLFEDAGWAGSDILALTKNHNHTTWRKVPEQLLAAERELVCARFDAKVARNLVITFDRFTRPMVERIPAAADAFRELGHADDLERIARSNPKAFFETPEKIRTWHAAMKITRCDPLAFLGALTRYMPPASGKRKPNKAPAHVEATEGTLTQTENTAAPEPEPAPPPEPLAPPVAKRETQMFPAVQPRASRQAPPEDEDSHITDWKKALHDLLRLGVEPDKAEKKWNAFEALNPWMWDRAGPGPAALTVLVRWLNISSISGHLTESLEALKRIVTETELQALLKLPEAALHHRLGAMGAIVCRDFRKNPELLLLPWETVTPRELRYRVNETNDRPGKKAHLKPYIYMLLEPTREKFLQRLNSYLKTH